MNIQSYFLEIKNRSLLISLSWLSVILVSYVFKEILLFTAMEQSFSLNFCSSEIFYFIFTDVSEIFYVYLILIFFLGNQILFFYFLYHLSIFISSGLYKYEYLYLSFVFKTSMFFFIFSVLVYNKIFFPFSWNFFLSFQDFEILKQTTLHFESKISEYVLFYISFYYVCVFYFQVLVVLFIVFDYLKTKKKTIKYSRKFFYYFFVLLSTLVTPPDVFSQLLLSISLVFSYEVLVFYFIVLKIK